MVDEEGLRQGYTRYGDWYGIPYVDWCAMFVSFCLRYAGIDKEYFPYAANNQRWIKALKKKNLYAKRTEYEPRVGDLAIFDWQNNNDADHVGIITSVTTDETGHVTSFITVEGNNSLAVFHGDEYFTDDERVVGYGLVNVAYEWKIAREPVGLKAEGDGFTVVAEFGPDAKIPDQAVLHVNAPKPGTARFDELAGRAADWVDGARGEDLSFARFFSFSFIAEDGTELIPQGPVTYTVTFREKLKTDKKQKLLAAAIDAAGGFAELEGAKLSTVRTKKKTVSACTFTLAPDRPDAPGLDVVATLVAGAQSYRAGKLSRKGKGFDLTLSYSAEAEVPGDAALTAEEIQPGTADYDSCVAALELGPGQTAMVFEIGLECGGMRVDPAQPVDIRLSVKCSGAPARVLRADGAEPEAEISRKGKRATVRFQADALGRFCLVFDE